MGFNFPDTPTPGQVYGNYAWDAATGAWKLTASGGSGPGGSITISDTPPASPVVGALWWESDTGNLYIYYNDGNSSQWVLAVPAMSASSVGAVAYTAQTLTASQQTQARQNVYAAPFDAMAYSGMQINGSMDVSQEVGQAGVSVTDAFICDGWRFGKIGSTWAGLGASITGGPAGFISYINLSISTAQASMGAGDYGYIRTRIEGYRVSRLAWGTPNAQPITIGFWTGHARGGVYTGAIRNNLGNRSYVFSYMQAANTFQYNVVTIPGCTDGTWELTNLTGLEVAFTFAGGTTYTSPSLNTWYATNYIAGPGQVNAVAATSDVFRITGVVVLPGIEAPSAARSALIMRPYDQELQTCKRYFQRPDVGIGICYNTTNIQFNVVHTGMRAAPVLGNPGAVQVTDAGTAFTQTSPSGVIGAAYSSPNSGLYSLGNFSPALTVLRTYLGVPNSSTPLTADARL